MYWSAGAADHLFGSTPRPQLGRVWHSNTSPGEDNEAYAVSCGGPREWVRIVMKNKERLK